MIQNSIIQSVILIRKISSDSRKNDLKIITDISIDARDIFNE